MLQDVQELRENNWVTRKMQEQSLKTIDQVREAAHGSRFNLICNIYICMLCFQIHHEAKVEEEKEKQFVAQAIASSMKRRGRRKKGSTKPDDWPSGEKGDRDRRDKDRDHERERDGDRERDSCEPKEKLDAQKLQLVSLEKMKFEQVVHVHVSVIHVYIQLYIMYALNM